MLAEGTGRPCYVYTYILVNVTAACDRGCAASVGLLVANEVKRKTKRERRLRFAAAAEVPLHARKRERLLLGIEPPIYIPRYYGNRRLRNLISAKSPELLS